MHYGILEKKPLKLDFLQEDNPELSAEKLSMVSAVQLTIAAGLTILGVAPIDEMR